MRSLVVGVTEEFCAEEVVSRAFRGMGGSDPVTALVMTYVRSGVGACCNRSSDALYFTAGAQTSR